MTSDELLAILNSATAKRRADILQAFLSVPLDAFDGIAIRGCGTVAANLRDPIETAVTTTTWANLERLERCETDFVLTVSPDCKSPWSGKKTGEAITLKPPGEADVKVTVDL